MSQNKNNKTVWSTRITKDTSSIFQKVGSSLSVDKRLFKEDIAGSIAHVEMLFKQKIITFKIKNKTIWGLNKIRNEIIKKKFIFNPKHEDIHMSIEKRLFEIVGDDARSEEHTSELQSQAYLVCRLLLEKKKTPDHNSTIIKSYTNDKTRTTY